MNELIENTLLPLGIDINYLERVGDKFPQIVYSFNEYTNSSGDNKEETLRYDIYLNLYIEENINATVKKIKEALSKANFIKLVVNNPIKFEGVNYYQITMNYKKVIPA